MGSAGSLLENTEDFSSVIQKVTGMANNLRFNLLKSRPFYGYVITKLCKLEFSTSVETACTNGVNITINPKFAGTLSMRQINFLLLHEMYHIILNHGSRWKKLGEPASKHDMWNYACDLCINCELVMEDNEYYNMHSPIDIIPGVLLAGKGAGRAVDLREYSAEEVYRLLHIMPVTAEDVRDSLPELADFAPLLEGKDGVYLSLNGEEYLVHIPDAKDKVPDFTNDVGECDFKCKEMIDRVLREASQKGYSVHGAAARRLDVILKKSKVRWDIYLRRFLSLVISDESSYDHPNKKYLPYDLILPGDGGLDEKLDDIFVFLDTSGSIGGDELALILNQVYTIADEFNTTVSIGLFTSKLYWVKRDVKWEEVADVLKTAPYKSGGTSVDGIYTYLEDNRIQSTCYVLFTDGEFTVPTVRKRFSSKTLVALTDSTEYDKKLEKLGRIVSLR